MLWELVGRRKLEHALTFLANPWKLWETGQIKLRRTLLKLAFRDHLEYCRIEGPRTPKTAFLFKALEGYKGVETSFGAPERTNLEPAQLS